MTNQSAKNNSTAPTLAPGTYNFTERDQFYCLQCDAITFHSAKDLEGGPRSNPAYKGHVLIPIPPARTIKIGADEWILLTDEKQRDAYLQTIERFGYSIENFSLFDIRRLIRRLALPFWLTIRESRHEQYNGPDYIQGEIVALTLEQLLCLFTAAQTQAQELGLPTTRAERLARRAPAPMEQEEPELDIAKIHDDMDSAESNRRLWLGTREGLA